MPRSDREQTDESLRLEREKTDRTVGEKLAAIDDTADAVILRARARADEVLAAARARRGPSSGSRPSSPSSASLAAEREIEDETVRRARDDADNKLRSERAQQVANLSIDRAETDKDLSSERARSDADLATRDELLGIVGHELRNMLHGIMGFAALIESEAHTPRGEDTGLHARRIQRAGSRMSRLVCDLVDVASIQAGKLAVSSTLGDPTEVVDEAIEALRPVALSRDISLVVEVEAPLAPIFFDPERILQVLVNLLSNAIKFTPAGGSVGARLQRVGSDLVFTFSDTGAGIPADQLDAIFERFHQVKKNDRRGAGLGLYISKCIVQGHGGRIWVESEPGVGSTFCFTLPNAA
ncbi:MAG: HAMP domain-containing histidine kinase [Myxococcales bacterium]|nr:HAMP domain-containing histidine kinase [Myxococcales bacterium]